MREQIEKQLSQDSPLKASKMAKILGLDRKTVNSFLHSNTDIFIQNDNYEWSLIIPDELIVKLTAKKWIDCSSLEKSLLSAGSPLDAPNSAIKFIIPKDSGILLEASARLLALCNQLVAAHKKVTLDFTDCIATLTYLDRMGVFDHLDSSIQVMPQRPRDSRALRFAGKSAALVELGTIVPNKLNRKLVSDLTKTFVRQSCQTYEIVAFTIFSELVGNVSGHSNTIIPGFAALQMYSPQKNKHIQTVVSDNGVGIVKTLKPVLAEHYPNLHKKYKDDTVASDIGLVTEVLKKGEVSRHGADAGRGLGFLSTTKQAMKFDAKLSIRQENFSIELQYKNGALLKKTSKKDLVTILGTHICFDFYVD